MSSSTHWLDESETYDGGFLMMFDKEAKNFDV
jgi:hypothetical protein